jgi:hypothetical protein
MAGGGQMSKLTARFALSGAVGTLCLAASPAQAQSLDDRFWIEASAYWASVDSSVRVEPANSNIPGTEIDFEQDLDLDDRDALPAIFLGARLGNNWVIGAEYYSLSRKSTNTIQRDLVFDDVTFPLNATVSGKFASDIYRATVGYSFYRTEDAEIGGAIGLHATNFEIEIEGEATIGNNPATQTVARRREALAPLPTLGLFGSVRVAPQVTVSARADYLSLKIDEYDGRLLNAQAAITYRVFENVGIGAAYRYVDYRLDVEKESWKGRLRYEFNGPALFLQAGF